MLVERQETVPFNVFLVIFCVEWQTNRRQGQPSQCRLLQNRWKIAILTICQNGGDTASCRSTPKTSKNALDGTAGRGHSWTAWPRCASASSLESHCLTVRHPSCGVVGGGVGVGCRRLNVAAMSGGMQAWKSPCRRCGSTPAGAFPWAYRSGTTVPMSRDVRFGRCAIRPSWHPRGPCRRRRRRGRRRNPRPSRGCRRTGQRRRPRHP